jgi:hypothetical protein
MWLSIEEFFLNIILVHRTSREFNTKLIFNLRTYVRPFWTGNKGENNTGIRSKSLPGKKPFF